MRKCDELTDPRSCMMRAHRLEPTFVLLGRDRVAALTIWVWCVLRVLFRKNKWSDPQLDEARSLAGIIRFEQQSGIVARYKQEGNQDATRSRFTSDEMLAACHAAELMMERRAESPATPDATLSAALETARKALDDICAASARRFSQDTPPAELQSMRDHDSGARLAWSVAAKIARSALAALDAATKPITAATRNSLALQSLVEYCRSHPDERLWQALRNWSKWGFILGANERNGPTLDTFHIQGLDGNE